MQTHGDAAGDGSPHAGSSTLATVESSVPAPIEHEELSSWTAALIWPNHVMATLRRKSRQLLEESQRMSREQHAEMCRQEQAEARKQEQHAEEMGALRAIVTGLGTRVCNLETRVERIEHHLFQSADRVGLLQQRRNSDRTSSVALQMDSNNGKQCVRAAHFVAEAHLSTAASIAANGAAAYKQSMTGASERPDAIGNSDFASGKRVCLLSSPLPALFSEPATT